jgi:phosphoserine aminotransferase
MKKHNFGAGPGILPASVLAEAAQAVVDFENSGLSILETSHRDKSIVGVIDEAEALVRGLLDLGDDYEVMFLTGGASTQFFMLPMNLLNEGETATYVDTGEWASRAIVEAEGFGKVVVAASSKDKNYNYIPKGWAVAEGSKYLHLTSNNTIFGTQYHDFPEVPAGTWLVSDMSSDIFSRRIDATKFDCIYAGAQKNMGSAGVTMVAIRKSLLGTAQRHLPKMLDYRVHAKNKSSYNTPPVYPIYVAMLTMRWVQAQGGLLAMERRNNAKAELLYNELDTNPYFVATAAKEDRSLMNVTFLTADPAHEKPFSDYCKANGIIGLNGHRSVGGFRASMYNALDLESVAFLVDLMRNFKP